MDTREMFYCFRRNLAQLGPQQTCRPSEIGEPGFCPTVAPELQIPSAVHDDDVRQKLNALRWLKTQPSDYVI